MLGLSLLLLPLMRSGLTVTRREGALLFGVFVAYIWACCPPQLRVFGEGRGRAKVRPTRFRGAGGGVSHL